MKVAWSDEAWEDYVSWLDADEKLFRRLNALIAECRRTPFRGTGKPEPLKGDLTGWWSRRLTGEHRLIYRVAGKPPAQQLEIIQCRGHY